MHGRCVANIPAVTALAVHGSGTLRVVLRARDPSRGLEGGERAQDRSTDPRGLRTLRRCNDFDGHRRWREAAHVSGETLCQAVEPRAAATQDDVVPHGGANIDAAPLDGAKH